MKPLSLVVEATVGACEVEVTAGTRGAEVVDCSGVRRVATTNARGGPPRRARRHGAAPQ